MTTERRAGGVASEATRRERVQERDGGVASEATGPTEAPPLRRAFLALGSNLGDRLAYLRAALASLPDVVAVSSVYETAPVGGPDDQGSFLNCVVELSTSKTPRQLLEIAHAAEQAAHRVRVVRWGPRTLDVDVLLVGDLHADEEDQPAGRCGHHRHSRRRLVHRPPIYRVAASLTY